MLSCFHRIPERNGQTEERTDSQRDRQNFYINIARQCADARSKLTAASNAGGVSQNTDR